MSHTCVFKVYFGLFQLQLHILSLQLLGEMKLNQLITGLGKTDCSAETLGKNLTAHSVAIHITFFFTPQKTSPVFNLLFGFKPSLIHYSL